MATPTPPRDIRDLDVPLEKLQADIAEQSNCAVLREAMTHTHSPSDRIAYSLDLYLVTHPDAPVRTDADYPGWTPGGAA